MDLNGIEKTLSDKRAELIQRITAVERDFNAGRSIDSEEQAAELENEEVLIGLQQEAQNELQKVDEALLKLQQGRYDVCSSCGEKISQDRLEALPYVIDCINCAN
ncbi:MAG: TraR/DksA C4-type zinc finger protein [Cycloclasticus sp.]